MQLHHADLHLAGDQVAQRGRLDPEPVAQAAPQRLGGVREPAGVVLDPRRPVREQQEAPLGRVGDQAVAEARHGAGYSRWSRYPGPVRRVLITGMSGTGKSTVLAELAARGYKAVDTDYGDWHEVVDGDRVWREERIRELLATEDAEVLFVSGTVSNQGKFYPHFDHVVLFSAPTSVIVERLAARTNNPYGKSPEELAEVLAYVQTVEPLLRRRATVEIDTSVPLEEVVEAVLGLVRS